MKRATRTITILLLLCALAAPAIGRGGSLRGRDSLSAGDPGVAPVLEDLQGKGRVDLSDTGGKPLVLIFGSYT